jgi:hypothetical protein
VKRVAASRRLSPRDGLLVGVIAVVCMVASVGGRAAGASPLPPRWRPDIAAARRYARHRQGEIAFAVIDQRGRYYGYHAASTAPAASVFKVMLLASFLRMRDFRYAWVWGESRTSPRDQVRFVDHLMSYIPKDHRPYARYLLSHVIRAQRWGIGRVVPAGWRLYLKGGWGSGSGRVDHQVALLRRGHHRIALALFTQFDPDHAYGKETLRGLAVRLLAGLG